MRISRTDQQLGSIAAPALSPVDNVYVGTNEVLLMCVGFEDRAIEVLRRAVHSGSRGFRALCIDYLPVNAGNRSEEVARLCAESDVKRETWVYDRENPAGAAEELIKLVGDARLHIDVSGMSRLLIVQLVSKVVRERILDRTLIWYTEALDYPPTREVVDAKLGDPADALGVAMFLSSGVFGLMVVPELSSVAMQGQPIVLVVFPSWNTMQIAALRSELQASLYVIVHGAPPDGTNEWRTEAIKRLNGTETLTPREDFTASTLDYRETIRVLLDVYRAHAQREKIVVAPTGSKMQSVSIGIAAGWLSDLQIVYPTPRTFSPPEEYTRGVKAVYTLPLSAFQLPAPE